MSDACEGFPAAIALSHVGFPREQLAHLHDRSDEGLIRTLVGPDVDVHRLHLLCGVSRLLRLMDGLLTRRETGEGFVDKFSSEWLALDEWNADRLLSLEFKWLNDYYSDIQLYTASRVARLESPFLFGLDHLLDLTSLAYTRLKARWCDALLGYESRRPADQ